MIKDGYQGNQVVNAEILLKKTENLKRLLQNYLSLDINKILIAGCGNGKEAFVFNKVFLVPIIGIDLNLPKIQNDKVDKVKLIKANLQSIPLPDCSFPFIYNYHVLEHVENPSIVLKELSRVLQDDGFLFIGFPNRLRLTPSYINSNLKKRAIDIIKNNGKDYWRKLTGTFKNELGAHAGFSEKEFIKLANPYFNTIISIRSKWIEYQYPRFSRILYIADKLYIGDYLYPSNYYLLKI